MIKKKLLSLYEKMLVLRHFDDMCYELKMKDLIMDGYHPYVGQEAVSVGASSGLKPDDVVLSNHRPQGHSLMKGSTTRAIFCEMLGRKGGPSNPLNCTKVFASGDVALAIAPREYPRSPFAW